jgi:ABC-type antimicrobial peptide transport system permease subunit
MSSFRAGWIRVRDLFRKEQLDRNLDDELTGHLEMHIADNISAGMSVSEARRNALIKLGGLEQTRESYRDVRSLPNLESFLQDLRFALRTLRKSPAFTTVAILTLALGIGANTAIFSVFYGVLLRPLPYPHPEQIVQLHEINSEGHRPNFSDLNFEDVREQNRSLQALAEYNSIPQTVSFDQVALRTITAAVSRDFFRVMGVQPFLGRGFSSEEQQFKAAPVALVSYAYWKGSLAGSTQLSSLRLKMGTQSASVVGVMPAGFGFPDNADIWLPREIYERYPSRTAHNWRVVGRLAPAVDIRQSRLELSTIAARLKQQYGQDTTMTDVSIESLRDSLTGNVRLALLVLLMASTFFLLIACANVVNLMLAQAAARERELALRAALGAGSGRLVRQFLTESLLLSFLGGALGVFIAFWGLLALLRLAPASLPRLEDVSINSPVLLFSLGVAVLIATGMGVACAWRSASASPKDALNEGSRLQGGTPHRQMLLRLMIAGQLVTAMVLLVGAGLMGRSLLRVLSVDPGFKVGSAITMELDLPDEPQMPRRVQLLDELFARLRAVPGVQEVGGARTLPLFSGDRADGSFVVMNSSQISPRMQDLIRRSLAGSLESDPTLLKEFSSFFDELFRDPTRLGEADFRVVSQGFFEALGIPLRRGRPFEDRDTPDTQHVAVISESLAHDHWPGQDPIGQTIEFGNMDGDPRLLLIVGVVGDVRERALEAPPLPIVYVNYRQRPRAANRFHFVLRTSGNTASVFSAAREIVHTLDPQLAPRFNSLSRIYFDSLEDRRFNLTLIAIFSAAALLLAMAGIYGVNAYSVAQRTREIGVRTALGASATQVMDMILRQGITTAVSGIVVGTLASLALTRWIQSLLFEVSPTDPVTFCGVALLLIFAVLLACWVPARRATRIDPMSALRYE